ncbi:NADH dehydrogenase FAD-containing subunit [Actinoalloteichus hoggarensis]|uniref:NADH dehydrogenase-like protein YjlD n=1 Tax=Actinoalloteichus hoggarensis TaxID=1470176 RepID=A0A221VXW5_9PSEU|nr:FAD-dependent oxidoreductase [Actinoalloteichus hoggarensis]ASO18338.1 NADH dehydrogenase-like protein YjlD [Actinoalloteichus hoggarensis]MBB5921701.1 NADH dehydrogenase FAD-containing subunit [Actinoalloteichus hoggarensis]
MRHRIIVLGAGYAGVFAAGALARRLHPDDVEITAVNAEPDFVERMRLHQLAAGLDPRRHELAELFADTGVRLRLAHVTAMDAERRTVSVTDDEGTDQLGYDTLVYSLGSTVADHGVPGVDEHAFHVAEGHAARRLRRRLDELGETGEVLVVGGNLTAIEVATEIAESRPGLGITLATSGELGGWLSEKARRHLLRAFERLHITVHEHTTVDQVSATGAVAANGTVLSSDATVWAAGFSVHPIAAAGGLTVEDDGRITVDRMMRSVSHPDVYAAGDSVHAVDRNGRPLPMSCASAGFTARQATAAIIGDLTGRSITKVPLGYFGNCLSLGQKDGIFQVVDGDAQAKSWSVRGRGAARFKNAVLKGVMVTSSNPTNGLPARRHRLAADAGSARAADHRRHVGSP